MDSDVEFEDEWEVVGGGGADSEAGGGGGAAAAGVTAARAIPAGPGGQHGGGGGDDGDEDDGGGDITITLDAPDGAKGRGGKCAAPRAFTREQREAALLAHRGHALCLLARCVAADVAACDPCVQVGVWVCVFVEGCYCVCRANGREGEQLLVCTFIT